MKLPEGTTIAMQLNRNTIGVVTFLCQRLAGNSQHHLLYEDTFTSYIHLNRGQRLVWKTLYYMFHHFIPMFFWGTKDDRWSPPRFCFIYWIFVGYFWRLIKRYQNSLVWTRGKANQSVHQHVYMFWWLSIWCIIISLSLSIYIYIIHIQI